MITCNSQVPPFFGVPFLGGRKRYGSYFLSPSPSRSLRVARDLCFAQRARGPGPLGKMFSATLAIANAVVLWSVLNLGPERHHGPRKRLIS